MEMKRITTVFEVGKKAIPIIAVFITVFAVFAGMNALDGRAEVFGTNVQVSDADGGYKPAIAISSTGTIYVAFEDDCLGIDFSKSIDGGATFSTPIFVAGSSAWQETPAVAAYGENDVYVVWDQDGKIYYAESTNGGIDFESKVQVSDGGTGSWSENPDIAVDSMGVIYVVWDYDTGTDYTISIDKSTDGATFGTDVRVDDDTVAVVKNPSVAIDSDDNILVAWRGGDHVYFAKSTDGVATFSTPVQVDDSDLEARNPSIGVDADGNIFVAWEDMRDFKDIYVAVSSDGGASFGAGVKVNDDTGDTEKKNPSLAVHPCGKIFVAWQDGRNGDAEIYFANSTDRGASFGTNAKVNDAPPATGYDHGHPSLAVGDDTEVYVVWEDRRAGSPKIYFAKAPTTTNMVDVPILTAPANNSWVTTGAPTFTWIFSDPDAGDTQGGFMWQADNNDDFSSPEYTNETVSNISSYTLTAAIPDGVWYWRVKTKDNHDAWSGWSSYFVLKIDTVFPYSHDPISINGNSNFIEANGVVSGNGTEIDPYIIENWDINASYGFGIRIENTDVYFIIRNCVVQGANYSIFYNVTNGKIENCEIYNNNDYGILLDSSSNNNITNCDIYNNSYGIYLSSSFNNTMTNCNVYNNSNEGIFLSYFSNNNQITRCTIYDNPYEGIFLEGSSKNIISNCAVYHNGNGIVLISSSNTNITNCDVYDNSYYGIGLEDSSNNNIISNCSVYNNFYGIWLYPSANNNTISANHIYNNEYGIYLSHSSNNNITDNRIYNNSLGIDLWESANNNTISANHIYNNYGYYGIRLEASFNNLIYNNYFNNTNNAYSSGGSGNKWNISKAVGTNIIGGSYLGGNYWSDYTGCDVDGDGLGDMSLPYGPGDYLPLTTPNFPPVANFTYSPEQPTDLETVQFTSSSTDPDVDDVLTFYWNFGDGISSTLENPTHQYGDNGIYTVTLTVTDTHGASNTTSKQITVLNVGPVANFTCPIEPITNQTLSFHCTGDDTSYDPDGYIVSYYMEFGDGNTEENPYGNFSHLYLKAGTYQVNLTVTDNDDATNTTSKQITVVWETTMSVSLSVDQSYQQVNVYWPWENITVTFNATLYITCYYSTVTDINISGENESLTLSPVGVNWVSSVFPMNINLSADVYQIPVVINITFTQEMSNQLLYREWFFYGGVVGTAKIVDAPQYSASFKSIISVGVTTLLSNSTDYDYDGIPDAAEVWLGLNPANASDALLDPDSDGWDNLHEYLNGTDMHNWDTDGDGLSDAFEIIFSKTDPTVGDTNGNGMSDGLEFLQNQGYSGDMEVLPNGWIGMTITCANSTIYVETNSSVLEGRYNKDKKTLRIKIHGPPETTGVANITIPKDMVDSEKDIKIQLDGHLINYTLSQNATHYFIHIEYTHSTHELAARFTPVTAVALNNPVNPTKDSLSLSWDACLSPEFDRYEVYQSTVSGALGSLIATVTNPDNVSYTVADLSPDTLYYFTVRVVYNDGFYADSDQVFEKTSAVIQQIPAIVSGMNVNVTYNGTGNLSVGNASATKIEFLKEKIPSGKKDIGIFVNVTKIGEVGYANITVRYNDSDIVGIDPATLIMYYWNETSGKWESCAKIGTTGVDTINKVIWANVTHFTIFAPMAEKTAAGKEVAPVALLSYIIIFAIAIVLISAGISIKHRKKKVVPPLPPSQQSP